MSIYRYSDVGSATSPPADTYPVWSSEVPFVIDNYIDGSTPSTLSVSQKCPIALANDTPYGLTASVYTQNVSRAHRVARALRAGTVSVNSFSEGDAATPFGGFKQSGFFGRDKSIFAHYQYTELKTIWMQLA